MGWPGSESAQFMSDDHIEHILRAKAEKALHDLRDYFRELAALRGRQLQEALTIQAGFALEREQAAYLHAQEMVQAYIDQND